MDFAIVMHMLLMACGIYMIYWAAQMKSSHTIPQMLVGKGFPISRAKDADGFMRVTFPCTLIMGIILLGVGVVEALEIFTEYPIVDTLLLVVMIIMLLLYGVFLMKAQKKYLIGLDDTVKKKGNH